MGAGHRGEQLALVWDSPLAGDVQILDEEGRSVPAGTTGSIAMVQGRTARPPLTTAGNEVGTIAYMAPERLNGVAAPSNDIFSLGVILHQMLTGNIPLGDELDPMPPALEYVVRRCIAANPEERFASADEVLQNFERAYSALSSPPLMRRSINRLSLPLQSGIGRKEFAESN